MAEPAFWMQLAILLLAGTAAWALQRALERATDSKTGSGEQSRIWKLALKSLERILFPISMLVGVLLGRAVLQGAGWPVALLDIAVPLLLSLAAIRIAVYILRKGFAPGPLVKASENVISTSVWVLVAFHLLGWLPGMLAAMDSLAFSVGGNRISLLTSVKLVLTVMFFWVMALWLASVIERRLTASQHLGSSAQVGLAKFSRFFLLTLAILIALDMAGIDLTALAVFGGALGVGLGFGLQRIASNFISGFIVLFDGSIRPGDVITVGQKFGWVQELHARYIVVRDRDGIETLIPNETLITTEVINWRYSDPDVRIKIPVQISYDDDPEQAMQIMKQCATSSSRVNSDPEPSTRLMQFADSGIALELRVWIIDPENGIGGVRSEINLAIWRAFKENGITIPYPQRDIHIKSGAAAITE